MGSNEGILIVEDEGGLRAAIRRHLKRLGYEVFEAATCGDAMHQLEEHASQIDTVLCDLVLPDGRGLELVERIVASRPFIGVIIMTGDSSIDNAISALQHGAADFLRKPFEMDDLEQAISWTNDTEYGLCSSVWTEDKEQAVAVARRIEAGCTYVNGHGPMAQDFRAPFGGFKQSGLGRNLGYEGLLEFMEPHTISAPPGWLF